jgi:DNA repair photolyase
MMMPILPFIEDTAENVLGVVQAAAAHHAGHVIPAFGMTVRGGQRA